MKIRKISFEEQAELNLVWCPKGQNILGEEGEVAKEKWLYPRCDVAFKQGFWMSESVFTTEFYTSLLGKKLDDPLSFPLIGLVTWQAAINFCDTLTDKAQQQGLIKSTEYFTLPNEEQWEYACKAGAKTRWFFGDNPESIIDYAWCRENANMEIHPPKQKSPNVWGLYDMYGNVPEWCLNYVNQDLTKSASNDTHAIVRGGWFYDSLIKDNNFSFRRLIQKDNPFSEEITFRVVLLEE